MTTCQHCGTELANDALFCSHCGLPIGEVQHCPKCKQVLPLSAKFCSICGTALPTKDKTEPSEQTLDQSVIDNINNNITQILETAKTLFYENAHEEEALALLEPVIKMMPNDERVLTVYLPILAENDTCRALEFIDTLKVKLFSSYTTAIRIAIERRDLQTAQAKLETAVWQWPGNFFVICHAALLAYAKYCITNAPEALQEAESFCNQLHAGDSKLERSWQVKIKGLVMAAKNNTTFYISPSYCKKFDLYTAFTCNDPLNPAKIEMVGINSAFFQMGSADDGPIHTEYLNNYAIAKYPVTQRLYERVMGKNPSTMIGNNRPVDSVSWYDCIVFCNLMSIMAHLTPCYYIKEETDPQKWGDIPETDNDHTWDMVKCDLSANGYRLPTEPEWEYAARGGPMQDLFMFAGSNNIDDIAWHIKNSNRRTHSVGKKGPNSLGLYDLSGNISEWCWDWYRPYTLKPHQISGIPTDKPYRVRRGGSWGNFASGCSVTFRNYGSPAFRFNNYGFRLCMTITQ